MGLYDYQCTISGVSLRASKAVLLIMEPTPAGPIPASLPIKGTYNRTGSIDMIREDANTTLIVDGFTRLIEAGDLTCDGEYFPFDGAEEFLEGLTWWGNATIRCDRGVVGYTLICRTIWDAIVNAAAPSNEDPATLFRRMFPGSTFAPEIYGDNIADVEPQLREMAAVADFLAGRGLSWSPIDNDSAGQHYEEVGQYLEQARRVFGDSALMSAALDSYERGFRKFMNDADDYLGPPRSGFMDADLDEDDSDDEADEIGMVCEASPEDSWEEEDDDDGEGGEPVTYEIQEFIFYVGDQNLGSFFMPVFGAAQPEPITRRLIIPPAKTDTCNGLLLVWVEETDTGCETMVWNADTPSEILEAQRLCDAAASLDEDDPTD